MALWNWQGWTMLAVIIAAAESGASDTSVEDAARRAEKLVLLVAATTLLLAFMFVFVIAARIMRRARRNLHQPRAEPTPTSDVWSMHKLPDDALSDIEPEAGDDRSP